MLDYDKINKQMDEKTKKISEENVDKKENKYDGSLLGIIHALSLIGVFLYALSSMLWVYAGAQGLLVTIFVMSISYGVYYLLTTRIKKMYEEQEVLLSYVMTLAIIMLYGFTNIFMCGYFFKDFH